MIAATAPANRRSKSFPIGNLERETRPPIGLTATGEGRFPQICYRLLRPEIAALIWKMRNARAQQMAVIGSSDHQPERPEVGETVGHRRAAQTNIRSSRCGFCRSSFGHPFMFAADLSFQSCQRYGAACAGQRRTSGAVISLDLLPRIHPIGKLSRQMEGSDAAWPIFRESDHWRPARA
jgi:hypothetical protein